VIRKFGGTKSGHWWMLGELEVLAPTHRLLALPGVSRRSRRLLGPLQGLIDDG
jgi:hypothetical protein